VIAALLHLVLQLVAGWLAVFGHPVPAAPVVPPAAVSQPVTPAPVVPPASSTPAPVTPPASSSPAPEAVPAPVVPPVLAQPGPPAEPSCEDGEQRQGEFGCVAVQLPGESDGRAYG
jgi:hypothetical protein